MTRSSEITRPHRMGLVLDPDAERCRLATGFEQRVVAAARVLYDAMIESGGDLDRITLAYVFGPNIDVAVLGLMDACHDAEHHSARTA